MKKPTVRTVLDKPTIKRPVLLIIAFVMLLPIELYSFYNLYFISRIFPNIHVNSIDVGKLTRDEATMKLLKQADSIPAKAVLQYQNQKFELNTTDFDITTDATGTAQKAYAIGRMDNPQSNLRTRLELLFNGSRITYSLSWNDKLLKRSVASIAATLNEPSIPPTIDIVTTGNKRMATVSAGRPGKTVDEHQVKEAVIFSLATGNKEPIPLTLVPNSAQITSEKLEQTRSMAQNLLDKKLLIKHETSTWELNDEAMINFLSLYSAFDNEKVASWSALLANTINVDPQNALFNFDGTRVSEFKPAKSGVTLDTQKTVESIKNGIQFLSSSQDQTYTFEIPVHKTEPKITTDKVNDLGIKELIGTGESWFYHSIASRIHNLSLASSKLHGVLIPPGEEFSMLKILGEIDAAHGYKPAYIIQNGRTILGDGGGVCQTSTTMFRAALDAGLEIKTRFPHAYRVSYYEDNFDIGVDASIFSPTADFTFVNDTPGHILVQTYVDPKEMYMRYELYGTSDGRVVERSKSRMWDQAPPPPALYQDDPSLAPGIVKQVDWAAWGAKTAFDWKVTRNGEVIREKTFFSTYRPWQAVYLRGPSQ